MFRSLRQLFAKASPATKRRKTSRQRLRSFQTAAGHELEPRRLLAAAPVPARVSAAVQSPAVLVSTTSFKAAAPTNLIVSPKNQAAALSWTAPRDTGGSPINGYVIRYSVANTFNWKTIATNDSMTRATVPNLVNGTAYVFQVAAVNSTGTGGFTSPSAPITPPGYAIAPNAPVGLSVQAGDGQVTLVWAKPSWDGGASVTNYAIQCRVSGSANWTDVNREPSTATTATVTGLVNGTSYSFRVAAVNVRGASAFSSSVVTTPASVPAEPVGLLAVPGNGTVQLSWSLPMSDGGRAITDYQVLSSSDGGSSWTPVSRATSTATQAAVSGLQNGTAYSFKVAAVNQMGVGLYSNTVGPVTPVATVPAAPARVTRSIGDGSITVGWAAPTDDGGSTVTGYAVQYSTDGGGMWTPATAAPVQGTSFAVTGLANGVPHVFRVAAVNAMGCGTFSAATLPLAPATVPGQPGAITATAGTATAFLSWSAPSTNGGNPVSDYAVQYSSNGGASWSLYPHNPSTATSITIGGLTNGIEYVFRVAAVNVMGAGTYSAVSPTVIPVAPVTVPSAPTSVKVQADNGQASLTWAEPTSNGNSVITGYEISYSSDGKRTWSAPLSIPAATPTAVVTNLSNGIAYLFRVVAVNAAGRGSETVVSATPSNPDAKTTVQFLKSGTLPVTVQFGYTVRDANGNQQAKFLTVSIGSLDRIGLITVPDYDRVGGSVTITITVRNPPRGMSKSQSFTLQKKTNYSMGISYNTRDSDPWSATTIRCS